MKIKKKDLRKREPQLPINYPDPDVLPESLPGGVIDLDAEMVEVDVLCKRLAHNEVVVRDAVLAELPRYLRRVTEALEILEASYADEMADVARYFKEHPHAPNPYIYDNTPLALEVYREKEQRRARKEQQRAAVRALRRRRMEAQAELENRGRFGVPEEAATAEEASDVASATEADTSETPDNTTVNEHKMRYHHWMISWCDVELVFLKLSRGLFFCLWHSDKPLVQLACAQRIADLLHAPRTTRAKILFYGALLRVLSREWPGIDRYRLDKYLALVRKMLFSWSSFLKQLYDEDAAMGGETAGADGDVTAAAAAIPVVAAPTKVKGKKGRSAQSAAVLTADGIPQSCLAKYLAGRPTAAQAVRETFHIFQRQLFPCQTSTGLTMHLMDVAFDEFCRPYLAAELFVVLSAGIPLYGMSQGNFVEKRVLDNFFPPIAAGVLTARRTEQITQAMTAAQPKRSRKAAAAAAADLEALASEAHAKAEAEAKFILQELARYCQQFAVARGTVLAVRVMFSEAELVLRQAAEPEAYEKLSLSARRRRLVREINSVDDTRRDIRAEKEARREVRKQAKRKMIQERVKARKQALIAEKGENAVKIDEKALRREVVAGQRAGKKKAVHSTKRKKNYELSNADLFGDHDGEDGA